MFWFATLAPSPDENRQDTYVGLRAFLDSSLFMWPWRWPGRQRGMCTWQHTYCQFASWRRQPDGSCPSHRDFDMAVKDPMYQGSQPNSVAHAVRCGCGAPDRRYDIVTPPTRRVEPVSHFRGGKGRRGGKKEGSFFPPPLLLSSFPLLLPPLSPCCCRAGRMEHAVFYPAALKRS